MIGLLLLAVATGLLVGGAELFVENAAAAGRKLGITALAVGLLLAGAEPEELLTAVIAALRDRPDLAAGDAIGANVTMLTACLGLAALIRPLPIGHRVRSYAVMSAVAGLLGLGALADGEVSRVEGGGLLVAYALLIAVVWVRERTPPSIGELAEVEEGLDEDAERRSPGVGLLLAVVGITLMTVGGYAAVEGAVRLVDVLEVRDSAVGLTLLALATTAELFALVWAAVRRGVSEIAVAGVVGSAAYNATATLGGAALAAPLHVDGVLGSAVFAAALPVLVLLLALRGSLPRWAGALLVGGYAAFVVLAFR